MPMECRPDLSKCCSYFFGFISLGMMAAGVVILKGEKLHETPELDACNATVFEALSVLGNMREVNALLSTDCHVENNCVHDNNSTLIDKFCAERCVRDFIALYLNQTQQWVIRSCERSEMSAGAQVLILFGAILLFILMIKCALDFRKASSEKRTVAFPERSFGSRGLSTHLSSVSFLNRMRLGRYHGSCHEDHFNSAFSLNGQTPSSGASREMSPRSAYGAI